MASAETEASHAEYCREFFAPTGECQNYASIIAGSYERVKTAKGYKCGAIVQVNKATLQMKLDGLIAEAREKGDERTRINGEINNLNFAQ